MPRTAVFKNITTQRHQETLSLLKCISVYLLLSAAHRMVLGPHDGFRVSRHGVVNVGGPNCREREHGHVRVVVARDEEKANDVRACLLRSRVSFAREAGGGRGSAERDTTAWGKSNNLVLGSGRKFTTQKTKPRHIQLYGTSTTTREMVITSCPPGTSFSPQVKTPLHSFAFAPRDAQLNFGNKISV